MTNEMRNELLMILSIENQKNEEDRKKRVEWLLERFEYDINNQLKELDYKRQELESNMETLEYVKKELGVRND